jgi:hypothetical protein
VQEDRRGGGDLAAWAAELVDDRGQERQWHVDGVVDDWWPVLRMIGG